MLERKKIREHATEYISLNGSIKDVVERFDKLSVKYSDEAILSVDYGYGDDPGWDGTIRVTWERDETDAEYKKRVERAEKAKVRDKERIEKQRIAKEKEERSLLEKLKKKYG